MGDLTIRDLDDRIIDLLTAQAEANRRSLEEEIRHLLTQGVEQESRYLRTRQMGRAERISDFRERTRQLVSLTAGSRQSDSVDLLREDRDR